MKTVLQRQIEATDRQIDRLVYELYGLTDEEIGIVEGLDHEGREVGEAPAAETEVLSVRGVLAVSRAAQHGKESAQAYQSHSALLKKLDNVRVVVEVAILGHEVVCPAEQRHFQQIIVIEDRGTKPDASAAPPTPLGRKFEQ